jgi:hypothetical protein
MNVDEREQDTKPGPSSRRPYVKPGIVWEETLEVRKTLAVACAKVSGQSAICNQFPAS